MHQKKLQNLISLDAKERYEYFIREVVQSQEVWTLSTSEGYVVFKDKEEDEIFPIWPHKELAEKCAFEEFKNMGATAQNISFKPFLERCIPDMVKERVLFGVFYNDKRNGIAIEGEKLLNELNSEYKEIWGE